MTSDNIQNNPQSSNLTEHILAPTISLTNQGDIKAYQNYIKQKYFPEPIPKKPKTSKAIVGLDIIQVPHFRSQYWPVPNKKVKQAVLKRDNYTCQLCGKPDSRVVDHINPQSPPGE